ncbi:MAG: hypothetical protein OXF02_03515 [Simkaniaceae bacterium]|nr:hypothetical protein [Simkaniaceae bacterium]
MNIEGARGSEQGEPGGNIHEKLRYSREQYDAGLVAFRKALKAFKPEAEFHQKSTLKEAMDAALAAMNGAIAHSLSLSRTGHVAGLIEPTKRLTTDYRSYINDPSRENRKKLDNDLNTLQRAEGQNVGEKSPSRGSPG